MKYTTLQFRVKDAATKRHLDAHARTVNFIWNYCNEMSVKAHGQNGRFLSGYDLNKLTSGTYKELKMPSATIDRVGQEFAIRRKQFKKIKLRWRGRKSLGWIPFKGCSIFSPETGKLVFSGKVYRFWQTREVGAIKSGSFSQNASGKWFVNLIVECTGVDVVQTGEAVGVDLGLKNTASYSDGSKFDSTKPTRVYAADLARGQRARKKKQVASIHSKISNVRKDALHKETTRLANRYDKIFVGDVSSKKLVKTKMAKSVLDAGWGMYRSMLKYKAIRLGKEMVEVNENYSTVTCSECLQRTFKGGLSSLGVREWTCTCGATHDRDVNAAKNILRFGHETLKEEALRGADANLSPLPKKIKHHFGI